MAAIELTDVTRSYGGLDVLTGLSLDVEEGELYGLVGNNGVGKTTTIDIITGQLPPDSGEVSVMGLDPTTNPVDVIQTLGMLPEREEPPSLLTPREYFHFVGDIYDIPDDVLEERMNEWAGRLDFGGELDTLCADLSRGQQQMTMITQAFLNEPSLVIIDEPLVNLDPTRQERVKEALIEYQSQGNTIVLSTHRMPFAEEVCTQVGILHDGKLAELVDTDNVPDGKTLEEYFSEVTAPEIEPIEDIDL